MLRKRKHSDDLMRLNKINKELSKIKDVDFLLERILLIARKEANADAGTIYVREGKDLAFRHAQNDTFEKDLKPGEKLAYSFFKVPINTQSISGFVASQKKPLMISNMYSIPHSKPYSFDISFDEKTGYKTVSSLTLPLVSSDEDLLGVLQLINARGRHNHFVPFDTQEEEFFTALANAATSALSRAQMTRVLLERMVECSRLRDPKETGPHVNRVGSYSVEIYDAWARSRSISHEEREKNRDNLRMAAMLHDVGKVGISDTILKKPGRFEEDEYLTMQTHTLVGARLFLGKQTKLDKMSVQVALRHHENWDGTGYPGKVDLTNPKNYVKLTKNGSQGLAREEIPLFARIVSLADVFDALSSRRTYKEAWAENDVLSFIKEESGKKFDPSLVKIFFKVLPQVRRIKEMYPD